MHCRVALCEGNGVEMALCFESEVDVLARTDCIFSSGMWISQRRYEDCSPLKAILGGRNMKGLLSNWGVCSTTPRRRRRRLLPNSAGSTDAAPYTSVAADRPASGAAELPIDSEMARKGEGASVVVVRQYSDLSGNVSVMVVAVVLVLVSLCLLLCF